MKYYDLTQYSLKAIIDNLKVKHGVKQNPAKVLNMNSKPSEFILAQMRQEAKQFGFEWTEEMAGRLSAKYTERSESAYSWLASFFHLVGDVAPNGRYLHVDKPSHFEDIWKEYCSAMNAVGVKPLGLDAFRKLRRECFSHVKFRKFKAVSSKCSTCAMLAELRTKVSLMPVAHIILYIM
jgi:hypothetical protein